MLARLPRPLDNYSSSLSRARSVPGPRSRRTLYFTSTTARSLLQGAPRRYSGRDSFSTRSSGLRLRRTPHPPVAPQARQHPVYVKEPRALRSSTPRRWSAFPTWRRTGGPEKAARGKLPPTRGGTTIVPTQGRERTGYPTQKPLGVLRDRAGVSRPGDLVPRLFRGQRHQGQACLETKRRFLLVDANPEALEVMARRFHRVPASAGSATIPNGCGHAGVAGPVA